MGRFLESQHVLMLVTSLNIVGDGMKASSRGGCLGTVRYARAMMISALLANSSTTLTWVLLVIFFLLL